jgi:hypothetical protein
VPNESNPAQASQRDPQLERDRQADPKATPEDVANPDDVRNQQRDGNANPGADHTSDTKEESSHKNPRSTQARGSERTSRGVTRPE